MSFIYENDELIKTLLKAGVSSIEKFSQTGPVPAAPTFAPETKSSYELAKTLLVNLQRASGDPDAPKKTSSIGVAGGVPAEATVSDFRTLGDFLQWAAEKQLTWNGKRFAWKPTGTPPVRPADAPEDVWTFRVRKTDRSDRNPDTRKAEQVTAYASKPELVAYLTFLRDSPEAKSNKVLQVMLGKIIGQVNVDLVAAGEPELEARPKPEGPKSDLNPEMTVDGFSSDTLDPNKPVDINANNVPFFTGVAETNKLKVKHLLDMASFIGWLRSKKIMVQGEKGTSTPNVLNPDGDACAALHILYQRASYLSQIAKAGDASVPNYSKAVDLYLKQVQEFGRTFKGRDGTACAVTVAGTTGTSATESGSTGTGGATNVGATITQMVDNLPLDMDNIDFQRINNFITLYRKILDSNKSKDRKSDVLASINIITENMRSATGKTTNNGRSLDLQSDPTEIAAKLKNTQDYVPFLSNYLMILTHVKVLLDNFYGAYVRRLHAQDKEIFDPNGGGADRAEVEAQCVGGNSVYRNNYEDVSRLQKQSPFKVVR